jgi:hypothetical protein
MIRLIFDDTFPSTMAFEIIQNFVLAKKLARTTFLTEIIDNFFPKIKLIIQLVRLKNH